MLKGPGAPESWPEAKKLKVVVWLVVVVFMFIFFLVRRPPAPEPGSKRAGSALSQPDAPSTKVGTLRSRALGTLELPPGKAAGPLPRLLVSVGALRKVVGGCSRCGVVQARYVVLSGDCCLHRCVSKCSLLHTPENP